MERSCLNTCEGAKVLTGYRQSQNILAEDGRSIFKKHLLSCCIFPESSSSDKSQCSCGRSSAVVLMWGCCALMIRGKVWSDLLLVVTAGKAEELLPEGPS